MTVREILETKGSEVVTVREEVSGTAIARLLRARNVGAVVVVDGRGHVAGIVSERDLARALALHGERTLNLRASELMVRNVLTCELADTCRDLMIVMTHRRVRHLPVVEAGGRLVGIVSIGDVVKQRVEEIQGETETLRNYIEAR